MPKAGVLDVTRLMINGPTLGRAGTTSGRQSPFGVPNGCLFRGGYHGVEISAFAAALVETSARAWVVLDVIC